MIPAEMTQPTSAHGPSVFFAGTSSLPSRPARQCTEPRPRPESGPRAPASALCSRRLHGVRPQSLKTRAAHSNAGDGHQQEDFDANWQRAERDHNRDQADGPQILLRPNCSLSQENGAHANRTVHQRRVASGEIRKHRGKDQRRNRAPLGDLRNRFKRHLSPWWNRQERRPVLQADPNFFTFIRHSEDQSVTCPTVPQLTMRPVWGLPAAWSHMTTFRRVA